MDAIVVNPTEAAHVEPAMSLLATVIVDPAATTAAPVPLDNALYGGESGKGAKAKSVRRTIKSGKALPVKDAKAEQVMLISTKAAKTEAVTVLPINDGTSCTTALAYASTLVASVIMCGAVLMAEHVLGTALPSSDIVSGPVETLNGATVKLAVSNVDAITVNDTKVTGADMVASKGIVHVIDTVLLSPTATNPAAAVMTATLATPVNPTDAIAVHPNKAVPVRQTPLFPGRPPTPHRSPIFPSQRI